MNPLPCICFQSCRRCCPTRLAISVGASPLSQIAPTPPPPSPSQIAFCLQIAGARDKCHSDPFRPTSFCDDPLTPLPNSHGGPVTCHPPLPSFSETLLLISCLDNRIFKHISKRTSLERDVLTVQRTVCEGSQSPRSLSTRLDS